MHFLIIFTAVGTGQGFVVQKEQYDFFSHVLSLNAAIQFQQDILKDSTRITPGETNFSFKNFFKLICPKENCFYLAQNHLLFIISSFFYSVCR